MNTQLQLLDRTLNLVRWPLAQKNRTLQAFDSADEYLINHIESQSQVTATSKILIINDSFGALSCWFSDKSTFCLVDSYVSEQGINHNLAQNNAEHCVTIIKSTDPIPADIDLVIIKIPKNNGYLAALLHTLSHSIGPQTTVIAAGKTTDIHNSTLTLFERYLGTTTTSLAKKKSRLIFSNYQQKPATPSPYPITWPLTLDNQHQLTMVNHANVFSRDSLDIAAHLFLPNLPNCDGLSVIDQGCGNGVIGLSVMKLFSASMVKFVDESYMAIASAQDSVRQNFAPAARNEGRAQFYVDDCLTKQPDSSADVVLCNPPFHQQQAVTDHIAWQMFKDALRVLKPGGQLRIVGNRNLAYHHKLKRLFANCEQIASNKKFVVLAAYKRR